MYEEIDRRLHLQMCQQDQGPANLKIHDQSLRKIIWICVISHLVIPLSNLKFTMVSPPAGSVLKLEEEKSVKTTAKTLFQHQGRTLAARVSLHLWAISRTWTTRPDINFVHKMMFQTLASCSKSSSFVYTVLNSFRYVIIFNEVRNVHVNINMNT